MSIRFLNNKSGSGGQTQLNIFMQETEPEIKKGIWLQKEKDFENIVFDTNVINNDKWDNINNYGTMPATSVSSRCIYYNGFVYMFRN